MCFLNFLLNVFDFFYYRKGTTFGCPLSILWVPRPILVLAMGPIQVMIHTALVTTTGPWPTCRGRSTGLHSYKILNSSNSIITITQLYPALRRWEMQVRRYIGDLNQGQLMVLTNTLRNQDDLTLWK